MNTEDIKKWMEEKGFDNSALAIDSNHRVSLYLSDVLGEFEESIVKNLTIQRVTQQSEQFFALLRYTMPDQFTDIALKNIVKGFIEQSK